MATDTSGLLGSIGEATGDELRILEMSLNKNDIMCKFTLWFYKSCSGQVKVGNIEAKEIVYCFTFHYGKDWSQS